MKKKDLLESSIYWEIFHSIDFDKIVDHPNILIAAHFWDKERYQAAKVCYKFMRAVDDLVDNYKSEHKGIALDEKPHLEQKVKEWISIVMNNEDKNALYAEVTETIRRFHIPAAPLEDFAQSMIYDIYNDGFPTLQGFLDYANGASVAPASIFVHLCGLRQEKDSYLPPLFDVKKAATPCAIFSYLVHIIRDFVKDHLNHLNYFPDDLLQKYELDREKLLTMAQGGELSEGFRKLIAELYLAADEYRIKTLTEIERISPLLETRSRLSLHIIFSLYTMVFERIDVKHGSFSSKELNPTPAEIKAQVRQIILSFEKEEGLSVQVD